MSLPKSLKDKIDKRIAEGTLRELVDLDHLVDFYSNDYLGISKIAFGNNYNHGSTGSRLISGNSRLIEDVEQRLADFYNQPSGLLYNSGFDANIGIFSCILERGDTVIMDSLCHASIRDGIRLSFARGYAFRHNDLNHLEDKLKLALGNVYVVVESVYSMDGDEAPLEDIIELCKTYGAHLIVDEAHSGGIMGDGGRGLVYEQGLDKDIFLKLITFGKAYGSSGAIALCSKELRQYLINFSRPFIYTTGLPPYAAARILRLVRTVAGMDKARVKIKKNIKLFRKLAKEKNLNLLKSESPIQAIIIPDIEELKAKTEELIRAGFAVRAISKPTVPEGSERIRFCIHSYNTKSEIREIFDHF